ncbi:hypothetical protein TNCV_2150031 [Trichonephila clavipes]|nr:hypothetical protein TNCV_2150031 [Trichonephila clavipes]
MITNFIIPELNNHDVQELWFQQDGATCHTARAPIDLLKDTFGDRLIPVLDLGSGLESMIRQKQNRFRVRYSSAGKTAF